MCSRQGVVIRTLLRVVFAVKLIRVTFADSTLQGRVLNRPYIDMHGADTIIAVSRLSVIDVVVCFGDVGVAAPGVRDFIRAELDRILHDEVGAVNTQAEAVDAVAAELGREMIAIFACTIENLRAYCLTALDMFP